MRIVIACLIPLTAAGALAQDETVVTEWLFDADGDLEGWAINGHIEGGKVEGSLLSGKCIDWDPFIISPVFEFAATPWQVLEITMRSDTDGGAQVFYTNTLETEYGGFTPDKNLAFSIIGDGEMRAYRLRPYWQAEGTIIKMRVDLAEGMDFAIDSIRVLDAGPAGEPVDPRWEFDRDLEGWAVEGARLRSAENRAEFAGGEPGAMMIAPPVRFGAEGMPLMSLRMAVTEGRTGTLYFASDEHNGLQSISFPLRADGLAHTYNVEAVSSSDWTGNIIALGLQPTDAEDGIASIYSISAATEAIGPVDLEIIHFGLEDVINRAGDRNLLSLAVRNHGGGMATDPPVELELPDGVELLEQVRPLGEVEFGFPATAQWSVRADEPLTGDAEARLPREDGPDVTATAGLEFTRAPDVAPADYVPEPEPAVSDYQVGVYYVPGWPTMSRWQPIHEFPERKPILGWYDEALPEVADWQIKWAVEHGVSFFCVDWYWSQGGRHLEHWLHDAYFNSRYRELLKFCLLWANHNPDGSSSFEDCLAVTQYWIDNYFKLDEYLKVDGRPVMVIFSTYRLRKDLGSEGVREAFDAMDELCKENGIPGIYMVACTTSSAGEIRLLAEEGYDAISGYNYPGLNAGGKQWAPYADNIEGYRELWDEAADVGVLKEIPVLSGGWDSRPWHGDRAMVRFGRTPELFEGHLRDAREFLDTREEEPRLKMLLIEAWNEWGEGSYIGPHREFGFGYLDAIRNVFTDAPEDHTDLTPKDLGLGPYDLPPIQERVAWDFDDGTGQGWGAVMQMSTPEVVDGVLTARSLGTDPAFFGPLTRARAARYPVVAIRMRASEDATAQLFWSTSLGPTSEARCLRFDIIGDGELHEYRLPVGGNEAWRGQITSLRLDPGSATGMEVGVDWIRLEEGER